MGIGGENVGDEIFFACGHSGASFAAAALNAVFRKRRPFDVAGVCDRDRHVFAFDQIFVFDLDFGVDDFALARGRELFPAGCKFVFDDRENARTRAQDLEIICNRGAEFFNFFGDLRNTQRGQTLQPDFKDCLGLLLA